MNYTSEAPDILRRFLTYHETVRGHSQATVDQYFLDLRTFFRYLKLPASMQQFFSGLKISASYAILMLCAAEMLGAKKIPLTPMPTNPSSSAAAKEPRNKPEQYAG